ncbi:hypothetical protein J4E83_008684 [Alternaria metachromatica]|uniref:uncharacterized protein n=1 Tax=Alternaria metachromatica TaxID=283354 RepID=UPI0020C57D91|nr:uncharacterized protein J4E83_008684 [Alternaria metachromatica]KAI4609514.1 hypothetical protein J4E83_008684 [Alternaria metachromatica]
MNFDTVTVRVGEADTAVDITVYRDVLSAVSPYFRSAFEGPFVEATDRSISLTDVTEQTFRMFLQWAHSQKCQLSNGAAFPQHGILVQKSTRKNMEQTTTGSAELQLPLRTSSSPNAETMPDTTAAIDEHDDYDDHRSMVTKALGQLYHANPEWIHGYRLSLLSFLRLYIFADKYNVPQLRDDILTAMIAQSHAWNWWPDIERELMKSAYANLPPSSKFIRLLVLSTAYCWLLEPETCSATRMRTMMEMNAEFAFEVIVVQNQMLKNSRSSGGLPLWLEDAVPDSCTLHEHLVQDAAQCRKRIRDQSHILTGLIEMCAADVVGITKESGEE